MSIVYHKVRLSAVAIGKKTGGGSRKGVPNRATKEIKEMIEGALTEVGGQKYLVQQAQENPVAFMGLLGKVIPKSIEADVNVFLYETVLAKVRKRD